MRQMKGKNMNLLYPNLSVRQDIGLIVTFVGTCPKKDVYFNTFDPYLLCVLNGHYRVVHYSCGSLDCHFLFLISFHNIPPK